MKFNIALWLKTVVFLNILLPHYLLGQLFQGNSISVKFLSDAPLEMIRAQSKLLRGVLDFDNNKFAFSISVESFEGFNSPLQREHFQENYLEVSKYENATFTGKIIEDISALPIGKNDIRSKGTLTIHGKTQERIVKCFINISEDQAVISAKFSVLLEDHNIKIPKLVYQKIAEEIQIEVHGILYRQ